MQMPGLNLKGIQLFDIHDAISIPDFFVVYGCMWSKNPSTYSTSNIQLHIDI